MSQRVLAEAIGMRHAQYNAYETMRQPPLGKEGDWLPTARKIANFHGVEPEYLWPGVVIGIEQTVFTREVSEDEAMLMGGAPRPALGPGERMEYDETLGQIEEVLHELPEREADMLARWFGLRDYHSHTWEEIGQAYGLSRERVRQITVRGVDKLAREMSHREWSTGTHPLEMLRSLRPREL
jgi:RNA polymerase sigma factor (sigma-70 family)